MRRLARLALFGLAFPAAAVAGGVWLNTNAGGDWLARRISGAASSDDFGLSIGKIEGALSSHVVAREITLSDAKGEWLRIDQVDVDWSRLALLRRVAQVDEVRVGRVEIRRQPIVSKSEQAPASSGPLIPDLPVEVRLRSLTVGGIELSRDVAGVPASFAAHAEGELAGGGAAAKLAIQRTDAPGEVILDARVSANFANADLKLSINEPAGGVIARLAAIDGLPPVAIELDGRGGVDDFTARLTASAGPDIGATGEARALRDGISHNVTAAIDARLAPLLPPSAAAFLAGATRLVARARIGDDGALGVDEITLANEALRLDARGALTASGEMDFIGTLQQSPQRPNAALKAKALDAAFRAQGSLTRPNVTLDFNGADIESPAGRFGKIILKAGVQPPGVATPSNDQFDVRIETSGEQLAFADSTLAELIGTEFEANIQARARRNGDMEISVADVSLRAGDASFTGKVGPNDMAGRLTLSSENLSAFARLSGQKLRGALTFAADLKGAPAQGRIGATLSGEITEPSTGIAAVDGLVGRKLAMSGKVSMADGAASFEKFALVADHMRIAVDGAISAANSNLKVTADIPDVRRADPRVRGRARLAALLDGPHTQSKATVSVTLEDGAAGGRSIPKLAISADATDVFGALQAALRLDGTIDGGAAKGQARVRRTGDATAIDGVDFAIGDATLRGAIQVANGLANGRLRISAPDLDDLSALALNKLAGRLDIDVALDAKDGGQNIAVTAKGEGVRAPQVSIDKLDARFSALDLFRRPAIDGQISVDQAKVGSEAISSLRLTAKPAGANAALDLALVARGYNIQGRGELAPGERSTLTLASLSARRGALQVSLARPATIAFGGGDVDIKGLSLALGSGRFDLDGAVGKSLNLTARMKSIPLSIAAMVDPALKFDGSIDGEARVSGSSAAPVGDWKVSVSKFASPETRANGAPPISASARGRLANGRTSIDADVTIGPKSRIDLQGSLPLSAEGALDLGVKGGLDASLANTLLAAGGQSAKGRASLDLRINGAATAPQIGGSVTLADGAFDDPLAGVSVRNVRARLEAKGRSLEVASFSAETRNGGKIGVTGRVALTPETDFPGAFQVTAHNAQLVSSDIVTANADLDLELSGPMARAPRVSGKVTLQSMDVSVPDRLPASLKPIPGTTHIDARGFAKQMLELEQKQKQKQASKAAAKAPFNALLDLNVSAPSRIFVRGRGIDAEFGGELKVQGSTQKPSIIGGFDLRRGKLDMLTQRVTMTTGKLNFVGGVIPELAFAAETAAGDVTATVNVTGPANAPAFSFSSSPELPQDEVLARLLFKKAAASLSAIQAVQLATAIAQFSGASSGVDAFEKMRRALGVDALDVDATGPNGPKVGASRYLTNNISVGVKTGTKPEESSVNVGIDLFKGVRAQGETSMDGKSSIGVGIEFEY